jgi:uncharacterized damage-inducible protein DinB
MARPTVANDPESSETFRKHGIELNVKPLSAPPFDMPLIRRYCQFGDWAMNKVLTEAKTLADQELNRPFEIGPGTLRKTLHHICDAERWWYANWTQGPSKFEVLPDDLPIASFLETWQQTTRRRDEWLANQSPDDLSRKITAMPGGIPVHFRAGESVIQLCGHGTHHRAQCVNLLRRLGLTPPAIDYIIWVRTDGVPDDRPSDWR